MFSFVTNGLVIFERLQEYGDYLLLLYLDHDCSDATQIAALILLEIEENVRKRFEILFRNCLLGAVSIVSRKVLRSSYISWSSIPASLELY